MSRDLSGRGFSRVREVDVTDYFVDEADVCLDLAVIAVVDTDDRAAEDTIETLTEP